MTTIDSAAFDALVRQIETDLVSNSSHTYTFTEGLFPEFGEYTKVSLIANSWNTYYIQWEKPLPKGTSRQSTQWPTVSAALKFLYDTADPTKYMLYNDDTIVPRGIYDALMAKKMVDDAAAEMKRAADTASAESKRAVEQSVRVGELCKPLVAASIQNKSSTKSAVKSQTWKCAQCNEELYGFIRQYHVDVVRAGNKQSEVICAACFSQEN